MSSRPGRIAAVCFDLDDTLYPQADWLRGAWAAVAERAARDGIDQGAMRHMLELIASEGSDRGRIIDRALEALGAHGHPIAPLVGAFRHHDPHSLDPFPGVRAGLEGLARRVPLALVSDGDPDIQRSKLAALGLDAAFRVVVWSDEQGRNHRKPDPLPFRLAVELLGVEARDTVFVGDRPDKDVAGAVAAGLVPIRVRTGEWHHQPDRPGTWASVATAEDAIALVVGALDRPPPAQESSTPASTRKSRRPGASR